MLEQIEREPRLQAFERVDMANADALWESHDVYQRHLNNACAAIQAVPFSMVDAAYIGQILGTLSCKAAEALHNEIAEELAVLACEITP